MMEPPTEPPLVPPSDQQAQTTQPVAHQLRFEGKAGEFFGIWIVNIILSVLTLGIYSAWAKVRTMRYFYGNTYLDDSAFEYTAEPLKILKGRALAVGLLIALQAGSAVSPALANYFVMGVALLFPALMIMALRFRMYHTRWRGIRFGFQPDFRNAYLLFIPLIVYALVLGLASSFLPTEVDPEQAPTEEMMWATWAMFGAMILVMLMFPWWHNRYYGFLGNRTRYGKHPFSYSDGAWRFYVIYFIGALIMGSGILSIISLSALYPEGNPPEAVGVSAVLVTMTAYAAAMAYVLTARTNLVYSRLSVDDVKLRSELRFPRMCFLYVTNTLAIILTLGLAIPWAKIRMARYRAETFTVRTATLDGFLATAADEEAAVAEEISDVFAWDFGL